MSPAVFSVFAAVAAGLAGLVLGSFVTVVVYRVPRDESLVRPRSRCPGCGEQIRAVDNIPVLSWAVRRGRCHSCGEPISLRYPLTELASGALWVIAFVQYGDDLYVALMMALFFTLLLAVSLIDLEHKLIPNRITYPGVAFFAVMVAFGAILSLGPTVLGAVLGFVAYGGVLLAVALIYPKGMGMGDVKLVALIGLVLGSLGLQLVAVAAIAGFFLGGIGGIVAMLSGAGRRGVMPFGPSLALGAVFSALFGAQVADWYLALLR